MDRSRGAQGKPDWHQNQKSCLVLKNYAGSRQISGKIAIAQNSREDIISGEICRRSLATFRSHIGLKTGRKQTGLSTKRT